jgi:hypothetical protein
MGLNIKNREAHLLAQELSKLTGESMTTAVTIALRERLARIRQQQGLTSPIDFSGSARIARRALRSPSVPAIMATSFMTNADYLLDGSNAGDLGGEYTDYQRGTQHAFLATPVSGVLGPIAGRRLRPRSVASRFVPKVLRCLPATRRRTPRLPCAASVSRWSQPSEN